MIVPSRHSSSSDSRSNSPSWLTPLLPVGQQSLLCPLFSLLIHRHHLIYALYSSFTPFLLSLLWHNSLFTPLFNSPLSAFLLVLSLAPGACQSLLVTKWFVGALSSANFSLTLSRSDFFSLSLSNSSFFGSCYLSNRARSSPPRKWG